MKTQQRETLTRNLKTYNTDHCALKASHVAKFATTLLPIISDVNHLE